MDGWGVGVMVMMPISYFRIRRFDSHNVRFQNAKCLVCSQSCRVQEEKLKFQTRMAKHWVNQKKTSKSPPKKQKKRRRKSKKKSKKAKKNGKKSFFFVSWIDADRYKLHSSGNKSPQMYMNGWVGVRIMVMVSVTNFRIHRFDSRNVRFQNASPVKTSKNVPTNKARIIGQPKSKWIPKAKKKCKPKNCDPEQKKWMKKRVGLEIKKPFFVPEHYFFAIATK